MFAYQNLREIIKTTSFEHPIFEAYHVRLRDLNEGKTQYVLEIEDLVLLIEQTHPNITTGMVKLLKEEGNPAQNRETIFVENKAYRVDCNLALLTPEQQKEFKKTYKHASQQFKKAMKDYERIAKKQQKEKIKAARQIEL